MKVKKTVNMKAKKQQQKNQVINTHTEADTSYTPTNHTHTSHTCLPHLHKLHKPHTCTNHTNNSHHTPNITRLLHHHILQTHTHTSPHICTTHPNTPPHTCTATIVSSRCGVSSGVKGRGGKEERRHKHTCPSPTVLGS